MNLRKIDYVVGGFAGFLTGIFMIPVLYRAGKVSDSLVLALAPLVVAVLFAFGVWFGSFLSRWLRPMAQFGKFAAVGFLNASIDFGILNILSAVSGVQAGLYIGPINVPGFFVAAFNSYFWNKLWVFRTNEGEPLFKDFGRFLVVTVSAGVVLNSAVVYTLTTYVGPQFGFSPEQWLNIAKIAASACSLIWNFIGYRLFVFKPAQSGKYV